MSNVGQNSSHTTARLRPNASEKTYLKSVGKFYIRLTH